MVFRVGRPIRAVLGAAGVLVILGASLVFSSGLAGAAEATVGMGTAGSYAVLAGSTVTNTGPTRVSGDLGVSPGSAVTGFPPGLVSNGTTHAADASAAGAQDDLTIAYNDAAGRSTTRTIVELGGETLVPGVYTGSTMTLTGTVTLDALGDPSAVFIFQSAETLITASNATVALVGGASACNVFWQVGSSATLGTDTTFVGTVMALTSISAQTDTTVEGRLLARNGAVTLDSNVINRPTCASQLPPGATTSTVQPATSTTSSTTPASTTTTSSTTPLPTVPTTTPATNAPTGSPGGPTSPTVPADIAPGSAGPGITGGVPGAVTTPPRSLDAPGSPQLARTGSPLGQLTFLGVLSLALGLSLVRLPARLPQRSAVLLVQRQESISGNRTQHRARSRRRCPHLRPGAEAR